jgi:hypothetical protein
MLFAISNVHGTMLFAVLISLSVTGHGKMLFAVLVLLSMMVHGTMLFAISVMVQGTMLFAISMMVHGTMLFAISVSFAARYRLRFGVAVDDGSRHDAVRHRQGVLRYGGISRLRALVIAIVTVGVQGVIAIAPVHGYERASEASTQKIIVRRYHLSLSWRAFLVCLHLMCRTPAGTVHQALEVCRQQWRSPLKGRRSWY